MEKRVGCLHYEQGCACINTFARLKEASGFSFKEECLRHQFDSCLGEAKQVPSEAGPRQPGFGHSHLRRVTTQLDSEDSRTLTPTAYCIVATFAVYQNREVEVP